MRRSQLAAICCIVILTSWPSVHVLHSQLPRYTIEDLGTLNGAPLTPRAINASGHVAGKADTADGGRAAFLLDAQTARDLGSLGSTIADATAINDGDEVVGFSVDALGALRAFRYTAAAGMQPLDSTAGYSSAAFAINASGQVAGYAGSTAFQAFRYTASTGITELGTLGGFVSYGYGINDAGQVTGCSQTASYQTHAFVWDGANPLLDIGTLGGTQSCGVSINHAGQVAGWSFMGDGVFQHAFRYSPSAGLQDLGSFAGGDSAATAINDDGSVVGWSSTASSERHAFIFTNADGLVDLNDRIDPTLGWVLTEANSINASGQIVGVGLLGGTTHAFRLTPPVVKVPVDVTPPRIRSVRAWPPILWPPHHEMVPVRVHVVAEDTVDPAPVCRVTTVTSSEPDAGTSHQDRPRDFVIRDERLLLLRAELGQKVRERIYTITVTCADAAGNQADSQTTVRVVKNPWEMYR